MIKYISDNIADYFYLNKVIEEEEKEIYVYGLSRFFCLYNNKCMPSQLFNLCLFFPVDTGDIVKHKNKKFRRKGVILWDALDHQTKRLLNIFIILCSAKVQKRYKSLIKLII